MWRGLPLRLLLSELRLLIVSQSVHMYIECFYVIAGLGVGKGSVYQVVCRTQQAATAVQERLLCCRLV